MDRVGDDAVAVLEVRGEHAVVSGEMGAGAWDEGGESGDEVDGVEHDMRGGVSPAHTQLIHCQPATAAKRSATAKLITSASRAVPHSRRRQADERRATSLRCKTCRYAIQLPR